MRDLAFIYVGMSTFVASDLDILRRRFDVEEVRWAGRASAWGVLRAVARTRGNFSWFGGDHAFTACVASSALRRPCMVAVGGLDASWVPELQMGVWGRPRQALEMGFLYRRARGVFPVDEGLRTDILEHTRHRGDNIRTIPSGFDPGAFPLGGPKEDLVLTAAYPDEDTFRRKGLDTFIEVARRVPEAQFAIVGAVRDPAVGARVQRSAPPNLALAGAVTREQLLRWYQRARVYCQLSRHEGLPNALCEAMLCEAVPVGTPHYGIPVAIGDAGFIVPWRDPDATAEAVRKALGSDLGPRARRRIAEHFSLERRARDLTAAVEAVLARKPLPSAGAQ